MEQLKTRKQKYPRINMAFYDDNLDYVREAAYQNRMSVTEYVNELIKKDRMRQSTGETTQSCLTKLPADQNSGTSPLL